MFSKSTEIGLRAVIYIAQKASEEKKLGLAEVSKAIDAPRSFTAKILQQLTVDNGIVSSARGPNGGFYISEKAKKSSVRKILDLLGENELLEKCVLGLKQCSEEKPCPMHSGYRSIKKDLIKLFETKTIQDLANELAEGNTYINLRKR
jgi:Rrf2 family protein